MTVSTPKPLKREKTWYIAIKIFDFQTKFRNKILSDFERKNKGYFREDNTIIQEDGQIFVYRGL